MTLWLPVLLLTALCLVIPAAVLFGQRRPIGPVIFLRQKTPPFRAGEEWRSGSPCGRLSAVPQGLREFTLVERGRYPSPQCSCKPVTAFHRRVSMSGPL
jgi:hypothetical protein